MRVGTHDLQNARPPAALCSTYPSGLSHACCAGLGLTLTHYVSVSDLASWLAAALAG